jgi:hypothetical protein
MGPQSQLSNAILMDIVRDLEYTERNTSEDLLAKQSESTNSTISNRRPQIKPTPPSPSSSLDSVDSMHVPLTRPLRWESMIYPAAPVRKSPSSLNNQLKLNKPSSSMSPKAETSKQFYMHFEGVQVEASYSYSKLTNQLKSK